MAESIRRSRETTLVDLVDQVAGAGVSVSGDVTIGIAGVDLLYVGLRALLASVGTIQRMGNDDGGVAPALPPPSGDPAPARPAGSGGTGGDLPQTSSSPASRRPRVDGSSTPEAATGLEALEAAAESLRRSGLFPTTVDADPEDVARGLARLVLMVVELLRQLMERQALRRIEAGGLTDEQVDRMGRTLEALAVRMEELKEAFGLEEEDLTLDLGPLGRLT